MVLSPVYQTYLCDDPNLDKPVWMTQASKLSIKIMSFIFIFYIY